MEREQRRAQKGREKNESGRRRKEGRQEGGGIERKTEEEGEGEGEPSKIVGFNWVDESWAAARAERLCQPYY